MYAGDAVNIDGEPLKAWYASIDYTDRSLLAKSLFSTTPTARETTSSLARKANALLTINGGYFDMKGVPSATLSVVISGGQLLAPATPKATRPNGVYHLTRGAFGVRADRSFDIAWVAHPEGETYAYPTPLPNAYNSIAPPPTKTFPAGGKPWNMVEAIGGGPVLVKNGDIRLTSSEELFAGSMTTSRHPRTAIGFGQSGRLVFFLVDGRQPTHSMGMTLPELAQTMKELGCVEALNLDGGGSSAFVVRGVTLNKPSDGPERNVTSAFAIVPDPNLRAIDR
jgi:exopolysaccharide biosynthesis protein